MLCEYLHQWRNASVPMKGHLQFMLSMNIYIQKWKVIVVLIIWCHVFRVSWYLPRLSE